MSEPALAPRSALSGMIIVWVTALLGSLAIGILVAEDWRVAALLIAFGGVVLLSFAVQLAQGRVHGFIVRVAGSIMGALLIMGIISAAFGLAAIVPAV